MCDVQTLTNNPYDFLFSTVDRNYSLTEIINETNENHVMAILFHRANVTDVLDYGAIGDPKVRRCAETRLTQFELIGVSSFVFPGQRKTLCL